MRPEHEWNFMSDNYAKEPGILVEYMDYLHDHEVVSKETAYNYYMQLRTLAKFLKHLRKNMECLPSEVQMKSVSIDEMGDITEAEWLRFLDYCQFRNRDANGSIAVRISSIRGFYRWLERQKGVPIPPFIEATERPVSNRPDFSYVTEKMEDTICERLDGDYIARNKCIIKLLLHCGLGLNEMCALNLEDIGTSVLMVKSKDGVREIPLSDEAKNAIDSYLEVRLPPKSENPFFVSAAPKQTRMKRCSFEKVIRRAMKLAGPSYVGVTARDMQLTAKDRLLAEHGEEACQKFTNISTSWYFRRAYTTNKNSAG